MALAAGTGGGGGGYGGRPQRKSRSRRPSVNRSRTNSSYSGGVSSYSPPPVAPSSSGSYTRPRSVPSSSPGPVRSIGRPARPKPKPYNVRMGWGPRVSIGKHSYWKGSPAHQERLRRERRQDRRAQARQERVRDRREDRREKRQAARKERRRMRRLRSPKAINKYLAGNTTYQETLSDLQKALQTFLTGYSDDRRDVKRDFSTAMERMRDERKESLESIESDFASRGILNSGLYSDAVRDYTNEFRERSGDLRTDRNDQLSDLLSTKKQTNSQNRELRQAARREAIRRRAERLGL